MMHSV